MATWRRLALACTPANQSKILCAPSGSTRSLLAHYSISAFVFRQQLCPFWLTALLSAPHMLVNMQVHVSGEHVAWEDPAQSN